MSIDDKEIRGELDRWTDALDWYLLLRNADKRSLTQAVGRRWQHWYANPENRRVFEGVVDLLANRDLYRKQRRRRRCEQEVNAYDLSVPVAEWRRSRIGTAPPVPPSRARRWPPIITAALTVLVIAAAWNSRDWRHARSPPRMLYQTGTGGLERVRFPDGSSAILGGRTTLSVAFSSGRRSANLLAGEVWFKIAHDPRRPFTVAVGNTRITDVGTDFLVTRDSDRVVVAVARGAVDVSAKPSIWHPIGLLQTISLEQPPPPIRLTGGEELAVRDNGVMSPPKRTDTVAATAWIRGQLTFDGQPLKYVVQTLDRYTSLRIEASSGTGALRFSGIVFTHDIRGWLKGLPVIFPVEVREKRGVVRIQLNRARQNFHKRFGNTAARPTVREPGH